MSGATLPKSGERSVAALPLREGVLPFTSAGGAKPIAGRGGLEGGYPLRTVKGADSGFRRTAYIHPRRASAPGSGLR